MEFKDRLQKAMQDQGISNYNALLIDIMEYNGEKNVAQKVLKQKGNFSKMIKGERDFPMDYIIAMEKILKKPLVYLMYGDYAEEKVPYKLRNLEYYASMNQYDKYLEMDKCRDAGGHLIIDNFDEYGKGFFDYLLQYCADEGIRYLVENHNFRYDIMQDAFVKNQENGSFFYIRKDSWKGIVDLLIKNKRYKLILEIFNVFDIVYQANKYYSKERTIYYQDEFLDVLINADDFLNELLVTKECVIKDFYPNKIGKAYEDETVELVCPLLTPILCRLIERYDEGQHENTIIKVLNYAIEKNKKMLSFLSKENKKGLFSGGLRFSDGNEGLILDGWNVVGNMVIYSYPIDPGLPTGIKEKLSVIIEQMEEIVFSERILWNGKRTKQYRIINNEYILTNKTRNDNMYEMYRIMNGIDCPFIPRYVETKDGIDKFAYIKGENRSPSTKEELMSVVDSLREIHKLCKEQLNGKIYVHGGDLADSFVFGEEGLKGIISWENCYIGDAEEDIIALIDSYFYMQWNYDHAYNSIYETIKEIVERYDDKTVKHGFGEKMQQYWKIQKENLDKSAPNYSFLYCNTRMKEAFTELYFDKLNSLN